MKITVLGSGAWGTALALLLLENGNDVTLHNELVLSRPRPPSRMARTMRRGRYGPNLSVANIRIIEKIY